MIRETEPRDRGAILDIVRESGQFDEAGLAHVEATLAEHFANGDGALWLTAEDGKPVGVSYCCPEPVTSGTWNLLMLWVREDRLGDGFGSALVSGMESRLRDLEARLLIVETSGLPEFAAARGFYSSCGFTHEATVRDFFAAGDDKLIYSKVLGG